MRTAKANIACAEWLTLCKKIGWPEESLDELQEIWWRFHDEGGKIVESTERPSAEEFNDWFGRTYRDPDGGLTGVPASLESELQAAWEASRSSAYRTTPSVTSKEG